MIKIQVGNVIKKVNLADRNTFQNLLAGVKKVFNGLPSSLYFYYLDGDNDQIQVSNTYDLQIFLSQQTKPKLFIQLNAKDKDQVSENQFSNQPLFTSLTRIQIEQTKPPQINLLHSTKTKNQDERSNQNGQIKSNGNIPKVKQSQQKEFFESNLSKNIILQKIPRQSDQSTCINYKKQSQEQQSFIGIYKNREKNEVNQMKQIYRLFNPKNFEEQNLSQIKYSVRQEDIQNGQLIAVLSIWEFSQKLGKQCANQFQCWQTEWSKKAK